MPAGGGVVVGPGPMTPAVRALVYTNAAVFLVSFALARSGNDALVALLGLKPQWLFEQFRVWTLVTYLFVHDPNGAKVELDFSPEEPAPQ